MTAMGPKQGDLEPKLIVDIADATGEADLTLVTSWKMVARLRDTASLLFVDNAPVFTPTSGDSASGYLTHNWVDGETDTPGIVEVEVKATWPGGHVQTFPNAGYSTVAIYPELPQV